MRPETVNDQWLEANQAYVQAATEAMVELLHLRTEIGRPLSAEAVKASLHRHCAAVEATLPAPSAIARLEMVLRLTSLEKRMLLLCLAAQLDPRVADWCRAQGVAAAVTGPNFGSDSVTFGSDSPTFGLMRSLWADFDWSALLPNAPLRHWRILELQHPAALLASPLILDERVLHFAMGLQAPDDRINAALAPTMGETMALPPSQQQRVEAMLPAWRHPGAHAQRPLILLEGSDPFARQSAAHQLGSMVAAGVLRCTPGALVPPGNDLADALRLIEREALLQNRLLVLEDLDAGCLAAHGAVLGRWIDQISGGVFISAPAPDLEIRRPRRVLRLDTPTRAEQKTLWQAELANLGIPDTGHLPHLANEYDLPAETIHRICHSVPREADPSKTQLLAQVRTVCRQTTRPPLDGLAIRINLRATWDDLILPDTALALLREIPGQVRHRHRVFGEWAFDSKSTRGMGLAALFYGPSGTGKTLAAEILANDLENDLYQVDLSQVVSKYIGETEKHLGRIFDAAEQGGCILLLDEADALFGKRSQVKDSHDRHANIEVSYLLQRLEQFSGLAILTTNMREAIDEAFLRRLRIIVRFPFPDRLQRAAIWEHIFPSQTPVVDLDLDRLAQLSVSGGSIHNIALTAAFLAARNGGRVEMDHLATAARMEYTKLEKPLTAGETGGWL